MKIKKNCFVILRYSIMILILAYVSYQLFFDVLLGRWFPAIKNFGPFAFVEALKEFFVPNKLFPLNNFSFHPIMISLGFAFLLIIFTSFFNRFFCGNICPFGTIQELFGNAGRLVAKNIFKRERLMVMPIKVDKFLRSFKYIFLGGILLSALLYGTDLIFSQFFGNKIAIFQFINPWLAFKNLFNPDVLFPVYMISLVSLLFVLFGSLLFERFFCKYICPSGALFSIFSKISQYKVEPGCEDCSNACPMNITLENVEKVNSAECIVCHKCAGSKEDKKMPILFLLSVTAVFFGYIIFSQFLNYNSVVNPKKVQININEKIYINQYPNIKTELFDSDFTIRNLSKSKNDASYLKFCKLNNLPLNMNPDSSLVEMSDVWEKLSVKDFLAIPFIKESFFDRYSYYLTSAKFLKFYFAPSSFNENSSVVSVINQAPLSSVINSYGPLYQATYGANSLEVFISELAAQNIDVSQNYSQVKDKVDAYLFVEFKKSIEENLGISGITEKPASFQDFKNIVKNRLEMKENFDNIAAAKFRAKFESDAEWRFQTYFFGK